MSTATRWPIIKARMAALGQWHRPIWTGDDGSLRVGHSSDMVTRLEDIGWRAHL